MAASGELVDFDIIENQKENIQSLPGGRSARDLARIFSPRDPTDKLGSPSPNDTRTLNDAIRQEYEAELQAIGESDDPLDIYDRYVKWALNAYPSAQATAESGLLPLLERAVKSFLSSSHYKNDPRYVRLWLHYIRLFSDSPRETFAFMARHHVGEELALFYEEFAGWLESAGRWTQADEVYRLGIDREARPTERLARKYNDFQRRYEQQTQDNGPSSPALPAVRPALAAKVDPFATSATSTDPQAQRPTSGTGGASKTKSGKAKMAIFTDDPAASQPALGAQTKGWDSLGSRSERRKENSMEAKPWAGETLKAGKKPAPKEKMAVFRDESKSDLPAKEEIQSKPVPEHRVREAINPRTGRRERVFVDLDAVYPDYKNPNIEVSFEELRAMRRGWMHKDWRAQKEPLKQISANAVQAHGFDKALPDQFKQKLTLKDTDSHALHQPIDSDKAQDVKASKARKTKMREVKAETQTVKMKFDSPGAGGSKVRRKSTAEPTMTMHTRAATDEIYSIFNQPLRAETEHAESSDFDDDDYISAGESTVGRISAASSDFGDDTFHKSFDDGDGDDFDNTRAESVVDGEWTRFSAADVGSETQQIDSTQSTHYADEDTSVGPAPADDKPQRQRFIPEMPEDYSAPSGPYRDPVVAAQNRLPFMTPIVERTEHSFPSMTAARSNMGSTKTPGSVLNPTTTPGMPQMGNLLSTPLPTETPFHGQTLHGLEDIIESPTANKSHSSSLRLSSPLKEAIPQGPIIKETVCNPVDRWIRDTILQAMHPILAAYPGYHAHPDAVTHYAPEIERYMKNSSRHSRSGDESAFDVPIIDLPGADRSYIIRRKLGAGAYAPVYLAESIDSLDSDSEMDTDSNSGASTDDKRLTRPKALRYGFEAIKLEVGPPNAWEFYMIQLAHDRISQLPVLSRATDSIIRAHELHIFKNESILVEDYRPQGTLLDLVNLVRNEGISGPATGEGGLDEALAMFFTIELFRTVQALHTAGLLHGDIKADNCLIRFDDKPGQGQSTLDDYAADPREVHYSPTGSFGWSTKGLSLIDFGRGIDMRAFDPNVQFIAEWETGQHECPEIREMRPWTHQIDLYGLAGTVHVMLFGKYIESTITDPASKTYRIRESLKRYWERGIWNDVFDLLLNPAAERWVKMERASSSSSSSELGNASADADATPPSFTLPVLNSMQHLREKMEAWLFVNAEKKGLGLQVRKLEAIFAERRKRLEK
ncbi:putative checkpoint protein kinase (SldA) [Aspergillus undulatus]|uniref:putative checkpoint protein kinase (SldA) n=1 Tax=Aspergillus undulatus TaxID=1810928 RepID=UPI003CCCBB00